MSKDINENKCPLCEQDNLCDVANADGCWCQKFNMPGALLDLVPVKLKKKACICGTCIARFNLDPKQFMKQVS